MINYQCLHHASFIWFVEPGRSINVTFVSVVFSPRPLDTFFKLYSLYGFLMGNHCVWIYDLLQVRFTLLSYL